MRPSMASKIVSDTTQSWYDTPGYGDYVSVEGLVADGMYYPVCVTGRLPTIPGFTDLGTQSPSVLPESLQRKSRTSPGMPWTHSDREPAAHTRKSSSWRTRTSAWSRPGHAWAGEC